MRVGHGDEKFRTSVPAILPTSGASFVERAYDGAHIFVISNAKTQTIRADATVAPLPTTTNERVTYFSSSTTSSMYEMLSSRAGDCKQATRQRDALGK